MTVGDLIALLCGDGWERVERCGRRGRRRQWRHLWKPGRVTIAGRRRDEVGDDAARRLLRVAGISDAIVTAAPPTADARNGDAEERGDEVPGGDRTERARLVGLRP